MLFGRSPSWIALGELRQCCITIIHLKTMIPQGYEDKFKRDYSSNSKNDCKITLI